jgi:hypothetical protein
MTQVQISRSSVPGARPAVGSQPTGSLYVNFADQKLGYIDPAGAPIDLPTGGDAPVTSVNTKVGDVVLTAADVGAADATHTHPLLSADADNYSRLGADGLIYTPTPAATTAPVTSVNAKTGDVVLTAADVGAAPAVHDHDTTYVNVTGDTMTGPLVIKINGADAFNVDDTGTTTIGNADVANLYFARVNGLKRNYIRFDAGSTLYFGNSEAPSLAIRNTGVVTIGNNNQSTLYFSQFAGYNRLRIPVGGNLLVDDADGNGFAYVNSSVGWQSASDARLKENVQPIKYGMDTVMALNPVSFNWIADGVGDIGFIAQEVQPVVPEVVSVVPTLNKLDAPLTLRKDALVAVLVKAMQEQQSVIDKLEARLAVLEAATAP